MPYTDCPNCFARVRVPDAAADATVHCPKCGHAFPAPAPTAPVTAASVASAASASPRLGPSDDPYAQLERTARILSAADEAMLRELGSGSGLLEMTGEALQSGSVEFPQRGHSGGGGTAGPGAIADELAGVRDLSDRQFQIVGTALTMANKLTEVYKGELARTRRMALLVWSAGAVLLIAAVISFGWGMSQHSAATLEQSKSAASTQTADLLKSQVSDLRAEAANLNSQITDLKSQTTDLKSRYEEQKSHSAALATDLQGAEAKITQLQSQLDSARAAAATMPAPPPPSLVRP